MSPDSSEERPLPPSTSAVKEQNDEMLAGEAFLQQEENNINFEGFIKKGQNGQKEGTDDPFMDRSWSSSISEPQMDLLVYLKHIAILKTKNTGTMENMKFFDEKMLRALGSILTTYLKERLLNSSEIDGFPALLSEHERHVRSENSIEAKKPLKRKGTKESKKKKKKKKQEVEIDD